MPAAVVFDQGFEVRSVQADGERQFSEEIHILQGNPAEAPLQKTPVRIRPGREFISEVTLVPCLKPQYYRKSIYRHHAPEPTTYISDVFLVPGRRVTRFGQSIRFARRCSDAFNSDGTSSNGSETGSESGSEAGVDDVISLVTFVEPRPKKDVTFVSSVRFSGEQKSVQLHVEDCHNDMNLGADCSLNGGSELW